VASNPDAMTEKMSQASRTGEFRGGLKTPQKGERFRCGKCGMEIQVTQACDCKGDGCAYFQCCGQEMVRA
jgi:hypothetical protein